MAQSLVWRYLNPEDTYRCVNAVNVAAIRHVLLEIDETAGGAFINLSRYNKGQQMILLDMFAHLILFTKTCSMSLEKVSTIVGIMLQLHETSMTNHYTRAQSYHRLRELMLVHSVPRPPFSCGIFTVADVQNIDEYLLHSYFRHYKMYFYTFVPQRLVNIYSMNVGCEHSVPPLGLPALSSATPRAEWIAKVEEDHQRMEDKQMEIEDALSAAYEEEWQKHRFLNDSYYSEGLKKQLQSIKDSVLGKTCDQLDAVEQRLTEIEKKVEAFHQRQETKSGRQRK
uniref:Uncharacterized protein n=1 Tax=Trypanosoma congolense (strain IL3000) TaxID=1068625 RepID=G0UWC9_TRYCI|nr:conserved hypothetical protein [Trypanosoma congolense IL3000]